MLMLQDGPAAWAPVIVALATLVTALASAIVVLYNALRSKRIESKLDTAANVQEKIHVAVNGGLAALKAENAALKAEVERLQSPSGD